VLKVVQAEAHARRGAVHPGHVAVHVPRRAQERGQRHGEDGGDLGRARREAGHACGRHDAEHRRDGQAVDRKHRWQAAYDLRCVAIPKSRPPSARLRVVAVQHSFIGSTPHADQRVTGMLQGTPKHANVRQLYRGFARHDRRGK